MGIIRLCCTAAAQAGTNTTVVAGYFISWGVYGRNYHVSDIPAHLLTHLNYAFAKPVYDSTNDIGAVLPGDRYADIQNLYPGDTTTQPVRGCFNQLRLLKSQQPHLKTLISVGGWTYSADFSDIAASANARRTFAASCVGFMTNYWFDGVDIDWEYPVSGGDSGNGYRPEDADNLVLLLQELRDALDAAEAAHGCRYALTMAGAAPGNALATRYRLPASAALVDWIQVMAYDYSGSWSAVSGHTAPLWANPAAEVPPFNVDETIRAYLGAGVPADKILLGVPFVGFGLQDVLPIDNGLFQPHGGSCMAGTWSSGVFDYADLEDGTWGDGYVNTNGFTRHWDFVSDTPYLYNPSILVFISYEDVASIGMKVDYALSKNLRGIMYWSMDADTRDARLQRLIRAKLYPPSISAIGWGSADGGVPGVGLSWYAVADQPYHVWCTTNLLQDRWVRATGLVDETGQTRPEVVGANAWAYLIDTNGASRMFYQIRLP